MPANRAQWSARLRVPSGPEPETALLGVYPRINRIFTNPNRQLHPFKNQFLGDQSCEFVLFVDRRQRMTLKELRAKFADVCGDETRSGNRAWLIKRIAWRMQANQAGGLPPGVLPLVRTAL